MLFKDSLYYADLKKESCTEEELALCLKEFVYRKNAKFIERKKAIELYEKFSGVDTESVVRREPIPEDVRFEVWRRDEGKCVVCNSKENLEFDHIVPFSKGGSNTARNLQLLCESCNRSKSDRI
jgi:hypothetical protein